MRKIKRAFEVLGSIRDVANEIHEISGFSKCHLFWDIIDARLRYGAVEEDYMAMEFYRKSPKEKNEYNTYYRNFVEFFKAFYDKRAVDVFDHKENFAEVFKPYLKRDVLHASDKISEDVIISFIKRYGTVFVKPTDGCEGRGVFKLKGDDADAVAKLLNDIKTGNSYMIEQPIVQHPAMAALNPSSVNTVRIETVIDAKGEVHITNSIVVMGTNDNVANNVHHGGIMCHVEMATGIIDSMACNLKGGRYFRNPSTGIILPGYQLPNWEGLEDYVKTLAKVVPSARLIGWDIVILEDGYDVIEGNVRPGHGSQVCDMVGRYRLEKLLI